MKKQGILFTGITLILLSFLPFSGTSQNAAQAETQPFLRIKKADAPNLVQVYACYLQKLYTHIGLQDMAGNLWFSEHLTGETGYAKKVDLSGMPDGQYAFFVKNRSGKRTLLCSMAAGVLAFYENDPTPEAQDYSNGIPKAHGVFAGGKALELRFPNVKEQNVTIRVICLGENIAWENTLHAGTGFNQKINLGGLSSGNYFLYLKSNDLAWFQNLYFDGKTIRLEKSLRLDVGAPTKKPGMASN